MSDLLPGDRCIITDPRHQWYGKTALIVQMNGANALLALKGRQCSTPIRWIAPVNAIPSRIDAEQPGSQNGNFRESSKPEPEPVTPLAEIQPESTRGISPALADALYNGIPPKALRETDRPLAEIENDACMDANNAMASSKAPKIWQRIGLYRSHGCQYYRYEWGKGSKVLGYHHIPGGNASTAIAQSRAAEVEQCIKEGLEPAAIAARIARFGQARRGRKKF